MKQVRENLESQRMQYALADWLPGITISLSLVKPGLGKPIVGVVRMPRAPRFYVDGALYHVYGRITRGERIFADDVEASRFVDVLRDVKRRDGLTVFAWCLMGNHYHMAVRTGVVPLSRPMRSLQRRTTRHVNLRRRVYGPLWQDRFRAKLVLDERYLLQLIA